MVIIVSWIVKIGTQVKSAEVRDHLMNDNKLGFFSTLQSLGASSPFYSRLLEFVRLV